jgi:O-antigen ligase
MKISNKASTVIVGAAVLGTLFVNPYAFYDPFNVTRLFILSSFGFAGLFLFFQSRNNLKTFLKPGPILIISFITWCIASIIFSSNNKTLIFFGVSGRNTGVLAYISLCLLMLVAYSFSQEKLLRNSVIGLICVGALAAVYGLFQFFQLDVVSWNNPEYSPVFSFFGNPNFHSAFMAICLATSMALIFKKQKSKNSTIGLALLSGLLIFNIFASKSQQGLLAFGVSALFLGYCWLMITKKSKGLKITYLCFSGFGILAALLDLLQKLPWGPFLYTRSISERGVTWRAGWEMLLDYPIFGLGMDQYRDYFRFYKDPGEFSERYVISNSTSSHNVLLDLGSGGGFILAVIYILILVLTVISIIKVINRAESWNPYFIAISASWIAYQVQSMVSINQLALAIWGWIFSGLIIGYEVHTRNGSTNRTNFGVSKFSTISMLTGALVGLSIGAQPLINDYQYRQNLKTGNVQEIQASLKRWPQNDVYMILMSRMLREANLSEFAYPITKNAVEFNPRYFEGWVELSSNIKASNAERDQAKLKWQELFPSAYPTK